MKRWLGRVKIRDALGTFLAESAEYELVTPDDADDAHAIMELVDQWAADGKPLTDGTAFTSDPDLETVYEVIPVGHPGGLVN